MPTSRSRSGTRARRSTGLIIVATGLGVLLSVFIVAVALSLVRTESERERRTLRATGASPTTLRAISAATALGLSLPGAVVGTAGAYLALVAVYRSDLGRLSSVPMAGLAGVCLIGPALAAVALARRRPAGQRRSRRASSADYPGNSALANCSQGVDDGRPEPSARGAGEAFERSRHRDRSDQFAAGPAHAGTQPRRPPSHAPRRSPPTGSRPGIPAGCGPPSPGRAAAAPLRGRSTGARAERRARSRIAAGRPRERRAARPRRSDPAMPRAPGRAAATIGKSRLAARPRSTSPSPRAKRPSSSPPDQPVHLQRHGQPVGRGARESGGGLELGEGGRPRAEGVEHGDGLVEHADTA